MMSEKNEGYNANTQKPEFDMKRLSKSKTASNIKRTAKSIFLKSKKKRLRN